MKAIQVNNLFYSYEQSNIPVIDNVSFTVEKGSYCALVGLNGSGKSTLARIIAGLIKQDKGTVELALDYKVGIVFQSPKDQIICGTVSRDVAFGPQNLSLTKDEVELRTIESLSCTNMLSFYEEPVYSLSLGQIQKTALSSILAMDTEILILDESVSMIDPVSRDEIYSYLKKLNQNGKTIIHISHDLSAIKQAAYIYYMEKGKILWQGDNLSFDKNNIFYNKVFCPLEKNKESLNKDFIYEKVLSFEDVSFSYDKNKVIENFSCDFYKGTINCILGSSGGGKSTLLELASGLLKADSGNILSNSSVILAQQNYNAALFENFACDDVAFGLRNEGVTGKDLINKVKESMDEVGLCFKEFKDVQSFTLSGGQKRKLVLAGIIALNRDILLFDEPTAALDCQSKNKIFKLFNKLKKEGKTIIFATHYPEESSLADRVIIIEKGKIKGDTFDKNKNIKNDTKSGMSKINTNMAEKLNSLRNFSFTISKNDSNSILSKINPALKYILFLLLFNFCIWPKSILFSSIMLFISFIYAVLSKFSIKRLLTSMIKITPFLFLFCIFQLVFFSSTTNEETLISFKLFNITVSKLFLCLKTFLHTESALCCICGFIYSVSEYDLIRGLEILLKPLAIIKIPVKNFIILIEIVFRFIPILIDEALSILKTQLLRGALRNQKGIINKIKSIIPLFVPLVVQTIKRAELLAESLTVRKF